jgi:hypothetical protein
MNLADTMNNTLVLLVMAGHRAGHPSRHLLLLLAGKSRAMTEGASE